ncbi:hypothetical protein HID58_023863, partial [Brassica napus]
SFSPEAKSTPSNQTDSPHRTPSRTQAHPKAYPPQTQYTDSSNHGSSPPTRTEARRTQTPSRSPPRRKQSTSRAPPPSSREINSLEKVKPGMSPRFFSQKIEQKLPEKKIPSTQANATILSAKV